MLKIKRQSAFETTKDVHLKLQRDTHASFRAHLFQKRLSMQECFEEFARLVVSGDDAALKMLETLLVKKFQISIERPIKLKKLSELDQEAIYNLLETQSPIMNRDDIKEDE